MNNKLKLFIIDDEQHIRMLLKYMLNWESLGIEICGEASCAEEALQLIDELQPNIVFSDICMDYMDGIEFSRLIKQRYPYIRIVLLSGHNEFDYAARGIEAGVSAYLLKPLAENKITETIEKIKEEIFHEQQKELELSSMRNYLDENRDFLIENSFSALLLPDTNLENALKRLSWLGVSFSAPFFQIVVFSLHTSDKVSDQKPENPFLLSLDCQHLLQACLKNSTDMYLFFDLNHRNILLSNNPGFDLLHALEEIKITLLEYLDCEITIGVGRPASTLSGICRSFQSALDAAHYRTILGNNQIIQYNYMPVHVADTSFHLEEAIASLLLEIKTENTDNAFSIIEECINHALTSDYSDIIPVRITVSTIINHLSDFLIQNSLRSTDSFSYCLTAHEKLFRLETVNELKNMTKNLVMSIIETFSGLRDSQNTSIMKSILSYLEKNYPDHQLTLTSTARVFFLNPSYLSRLFKQCNNTTFSRYLTDLRLTKAGELLLSTSLRAYEIGEQVGFGDAKYFNSCFRKYYGMTTSEYRMHFSRKDLY